MWGSTNRITCIRRKGREVVQRHVVHQHIHVYQQHVPGATAYSHSLCKTLSCASNVSATQLWMRKTAALLWGWWWWGEEGRLELTESLPDRLRFVSQNFILHQASTCTTNEYSVKNINKWNTHTQKPYSCLFHISKCGFWWLPRKYRCYLKVTDKLSVS